MKTDVIEMLTSKDDKYSYSFSKKIVFESQETNKWYDCFDEFTTLLNHPKSLVRNRALIILASLAKWDNKNKFDNVIEDYLSLITDEKPITSRQCIKALVKIGQTKPCYISKIITALTSADLSKYKDSMRPLIEKDISETLDKLTKMK